MPTASQDKVLRTLLFIDAAICVAAGLVMTVGASIVEPLTNIPNAILIPAGLSLFPIAAFMAFTAMREPLIIPAVWLVILGNVAWVAASLYLIVGGVIAPTTFGIIFIAAQAAAVALLAALEYQSVSRLHLPA